MQLPDFLMEAGYGTIRLTGHRIDLYHIMDRHQRGLSPEQIHEDLPTIATELVEKVLDFARANKAEVDKYVAEYRAELDRQEAAAPRIDWEELRRRMEQIDPERLKRLDRLRKE
jgi:uncharacterized protein (DUF433 family)